MVDQNVTGFVSLGFAAMNWGAYIWSIIAKRTKPHVFTFVIWGVTIGITSVTQYAGHAGAGAWASGLSFFLCLLTVLLSLKHGERSITRNDWIIFVIGLSAIPLWAITSSPLPAAVLATAIDVLAYVPTFRKSYIKPYEEPPYSYAIANGQNVTSIFATTTYCVTTLVYPITVTLINCALISMLLWRRRVVGP